MRLYLVSLRANPSKSPVDTSGLIRGSLGIMCAQDVSHQMQQRSETIRSSWLRSTGHAGKGAVGQNAKVTDIDTVLNGNGGDDLGQDRQKMVGKMESSQ